MFDDTDFCMAQAENCALAARKSALPLEREKFELAGKKWADLAERASQFASARERRSRI